MDSLQCTTYLKDFSLCLGAAGMFLNCATFEMFEMRDECELIFGMDNMSIINCKRPQPLGEFLKVDRYDADDQFLDTDILPHAHASPTWRKRVSDIWQLYDSVVEMCVL